MSDPKQPPMPAGEERGFRLRPDPVVEGGEPLDDGQSAKFASHSPEVPPETEPDSPPLPHSYGREIVYLVAQDPRRLFCYWDLDIAAHPGGPATLRCLVESSGKIEAEFDAPFETRNWYIPVAQPGEAYVVEIGFYRDGAWQLLGRSNPATTPPEAPSADLSFTLGAPAGDAALENFIERLPPAARNQPGLLQLLSGLRLDEQSLARLGRQAAGSHAESIRALEELLGSKLVVDLLSSPLDSAGIGSRLRERLEEALSSGSASEVLARFAESGAEASLFSGFFPTGPLSSENLASWTEALLGWSQAARHAAASEWLSSWQVGAAESSPPAGAWTAPVSSFLPGQASLASWTPAELSSWTNELLASWQALESGSWMQAPAPREFLMHVNAEVIFYGGTHPDAQVTIAGKPVQLAADGSFRHHCVFPDGEFEIPVIATSPDGAETRRAVLRFERATAREGRVEDTAQPPLEPPPGRR